MKRIRGIFAAALLVVSAWATSPSSPKWFEKVQLPAPSIETLPNGLKVAWFTDPGLPLIDIALLVKKGSRFDPKGRSGVSLLLSSMLDRGAAGKSAKDIARAAENLGARRYISSDEDSFTIGMHGLSEDTDKLMGILADVVLRPNFDSAEFSREKERALDRWNHLGDYSQSLASLAFHRVIASGSSYGRGELLSKKEFEKIGKKDLISFHSDHFVPSNSVLMIVGKADKKKLDAQIFKLFGTWGLDQTPKKKQAGRKYYNKRLELGRHKALLVHRPDLTQAQVRIGFRIPKISSPDRYPMVVANALFGEYFNSRLNSVIRDQLALTYSIGSSITYTQEFGVLVISSSSRNESIGTLIQHTVKVLKEVRSGEISKAEVQTAKDYLIGSFPLKMATLSSAASRWLAGNLFGFGPEYLNEFIPKIGQVSHAQVVEAAGKHFKKDNITIVVAGDASRVRSSLKSAKIWPVKQVKVRDLL